MRTLLVTLMVLLGGLALPGAHAQGEALLVDAEGDTELSVVFPGSPANAPFRGGDADNADLLAFDVEESDTTLDFVFTVKTLKQTASDADYSAFFTWGKVDHIVRGELQTIPNIGTSSNAVLYTRGEFYQYMGELPHEVDAEAGTFRITIEKVYLMDEDEETPTKGDVLKKIHVESHVGLLAFRIGIAGEVSDRMPDDGDEDFTFQIGDLAMGHLKATAENRVRVSNGGSTTFVYRVLLENTGEGNDEVEISTGVLPEGWNVTVQSPVRIGGDDSRTVTVLASVPFGHTHGGFDSFNVTMQSRFDPGSRAVVRLGVLHTPVPQPAGHHDELFLHGEEESGLIGWNGFDTTMNTDPNHDTDPAEVMTQRSSGNGVYWWIPLNPNLAMGMDFDMERLGALTGSIIGRTAGEATVSAALIYGPANQWYEDDGSIMLAESDEQTVTLDLSNPTAFSLVMTPLEDADYIPFDPTQSLYLRIDVQSEGFGIICCIEGTAPTLRTEDFKLKLPLNEYHDKLTGVAEAVASIDVVAEGPVEKMGRPGSTMTYAFTVRNLGSAPVVLDLDLAGSGVDLGTIVPDGPITLDAKESRKVTLAVAIPAESTEGQEIEVLLFAHAQDDPSKTAIARTKTTVTMGGQASADETDVLLAAQSADDDTPGLGVFGTLAALGVALLAFRRR